MAQVQLQLRNFQAAMAFSDSEDDFVSQFAKTGLPMLEEKQRMQEEEYRKLFEEFGKRINQRRMLKRMALRVLKMMKKVGKS